jgi:hypothetical protein
MRRSNYNFQKKRGLNYDFKEFNQSVNKKKINE